MNLFDYIIIISIFSAGIGGYKLGFITRVITWIGLGVGLFAAVRLLPRILENAQDVTPTNRFLILTGTVIVGVIIGQTLGLTIGKKFSGLIRSVSFKKTDRVAGSFAGIFGTVAMVWLLLPAMSEVSGWPSEMARNSVIARQITALAPNAPDAFRGLRGLVDDDVFPEVFENLRPAPEIGPPPAESGLSAATQQRVLASTVKVEAVACGGLQEGSGFIAEPNLVVTNAHVVAGGERFFVNRNDGARLQASLVLFDSDKDLALLSVRINRPPLPISNGKKGDRGGVFGHPGGQDQVRVAPALISQVIAARGTDLYDDHPTRRQIFVLSSNLQQGDSGAAIVNPNGEAIGVAFAIAPDQPGTAYALTGKELAETLQEDRAANLDSGPCLDAA